MEYILAAVGVLVLGGALVLIGWLFGTRREIEGDRDDAQDEAERMREPIETPEERQAAARAELERRRGRK